MSEHLNKAALSTAIAVRQQAAIAGVGHAHFLDCFVGSSISVIQFEGGDDGALAAIAALRLSLGQIENVIRAGRPVGHA